jgi:hypothetical protein
MQTLLMFQSDANKKLNQFARWSHMTDAQRTFAWSSRPIVGAAGAAGITYGLKRGATNISAPRSAASRPTRHQLARRTGTMRSGTRSRISLGISYAGNMLSDFVRGATTTGDPGGTNPVSETLGRVAKGLAQIVQEVSADKPKSRRALSTKDKIMATLARMQEPVRETLGDPTVPVTRLVQRGTTAATFDARKARLHEENQRAFEAHERGAPFMHTPEWELDQQQKRDQRMMRP